MPTIRISIAARDTLKQIAASENRPVAAVLETVIDQYHRQQFLAGLNEDFARLRGNRSAWRRERAERKRWDVTLGDGLDSP